MTRLIEEEETFKVLSAYYKHRTPVQDSALHDALSKVPTIDAEPVRHGKWIPISSNKKWIDVSKCSVCGKQYSLYPLDYDYCPACGSRMDEDERD